MEGSQQPRLPVKFFSHFDQEWFIAETEDEIAWSFEEFDPGDVETSGDYEIFDASGRLVHVRIELMHVLREFWAMQQVHLERVAVLTQRYRQVDIKITQASIDKFLGRT